MSVNIFAAYTKRQRRIGLPTQEQPFNSVFLNQQFRALTLNQALIMGRSTYEKLGPVAGRTNIVVSKTLTEAPGATVVNSLDSALAFPVGQRDLWVIGGRSLFEQVLEARVVASMHLFEFWQPLGLETIETCQVMPSLRLLDFQQTYERLVPQESGHPIHHQTWHRVAPKL